MTDQSTSPNVEEKYTSATHTSNLRVQADRIGSADILIAAGWSASRLGAALLRLHSEYDGTARPRMMTPQRVAAYALTIRGVTGAEANATAQADALEWYSNEVALWMTSLKSLPCVREQVALQADRWGMEDPPHISASVIRWWLDRNCKACHGTKLELIGGNRTGRACKSCRGTGEVSAPCGEAGSKVANYINDCVHRARQSIKNRLHSYRKGA